MTPLKHRPLTTSGRSLRLVPGDPELRSKGLGRLLDHVLRGPGARDPDRQRTKVVAVLLGRLEGELDRLTRGQLLVSPHPQVSEVGPAPAGRRVGVDDPPAVVRVP